MVENGGHILDFVRLIMGPAVEVCAMVDTLKFTKARDGLKKTPDIEDIANVILRHDGGGISVVSNGCITSGQWGVSMDIATDSHLVTLRDTMTVAVEKHGRSVWKKTFRAGWNPILYGARAFVKYLKDQTQSVAGVDDGLAALEIANAAYESSKKRRAVRIQ